MRMIFFMKLWYNQSDQHTRNLLASLARVLRFTLTKIFEKKSVQKFTFCLIFFLLTIYKQTMISFDKTIGLENKQQHRQSA